MNGVACYFRKKKLSRHWHAAPPTDTTTFTAVQDNIHPRASFMRYYNLFIHNRHIVSYHTAIIISFHRLLLVLLSIIIFTWYTVLLSISSPTTRIILRVFLTPLLQYRTIIIDLYCTTVSNSIRERERERDGYSTRRSNSIHSIYRIKWVHH